MVGTLTHKPKGQIKPLLYWRQEGRSVVTYWDAAMTQRQTAYLIGNAGSNEFGQSYYNVFVTFDLRLLGITEETINAWGFATAIPL